MLKKLFLCMLLLSPFCSFPAIAAEADNPKISVMHYFADELGRTGMEKILSRFTEEKPVEVVEKPVGHEDFKATILHLAAEGEVPDVVSYWAGARTEFLVDSKALAPLNRLWQEKQYRSLLLPALAKSAVYYSGQPYLIPFGCHVVGIFYNPKLFAQAGIEEVPQTWQEFLAVCQKLSAEGIRPLALGAKNRWPAQFWFDYLLLRTAGTDFRQQLMVGAQSYRSPQVAKAMQLWSELLQKDFFISGSSANDWNDAADMVAYGHAAMTLMGTWITGYWQRKGLMPEADYDFFPFPEVEPQPGTALLGAVDGFVVGAKSDNRAEAEELIDFLFRDLEVQKNWVLAQGTISPNLRVSKEIYDPVMQKVLTEFERAEAYVFNYDLATPPPVAEIGLSMFARFLRQPQNYRAELEAVSDMAAAMHAYEISE